MRFRKELTTDCQVIESKRVEAAAKFPSLICKICEICGLQSARCRVRNEPVMKKIVDRLIEIKPAFVRQMVVMTSKEVFVQIMSIEFTQWRMVSLGEPSDSLVLQVAKSTPDTELVKILPVNRN